MISSTEKKEQLLSCNYIERGSCFALDGVRTCVHGTINGPLLATKEQLNSGLLSYDSIVETRQKLIDNINSKTPDTTIPCLNCANLKPKDVSEINLEYLGGVPLPAGMNIQHYSACNQKCTYCTFTIEDNWVKPQYDPIKYFELFEKNNKLMKDNWLDFSGGEPTLLRDFPQILKYITDRDLGNITVYSNSEKYSEELADLLGENKLNLVTSIDTGLASTYQTLHGSPKFTKVIANLIRYRSTGTNNLWLKYVVTKNNISQDDMWSFIFCMSAIKPNRIMISPDFPYGNKSVDADIVNFAGELWHNIERFIGVTPVDYTAEFGDEPFVKYRIELQASIVDARARMEKICGDDFPKIKSSASYNAIKANLIIGKEVGVNDRILIYGAGASARELMTHTDLQFHNIIGFIDGNVTKQGMDFMGRPVIAPEELNKLNHDIIIISSKVNGSAMRKNLTRLYNDQIRLARVIDL